MEMDKFPVKIGETAQLMDLKKKINETRATARKLLKSPTPPSLDELQQCIDAGSEIDIPEIESLQQVSEFMHFVSEINQGMNENLSFYSDIS